MAPKFTLKLPGFKNLKKNLKNQTAPGNPMRKFVKQMGVQYLAFVKRRFRAKSSAGGLWPDIEEATKKRKKSTKILIDEGFLFLALSIGTGGNRFKIIRNGIEVGYSDTAIHPGKRGGQSSTLTFAELANIHQTGKGNNPVRIIFEQPDERTIRKMLKTLPKSIEESTKK